METTSEQERKTIRVKRIAKRLTKKVALKRKQQILNKRYTDALEYNEIIIGDYKFTLLSYNPNGRGLMNVQSEGLVDGKIVHFAMYQSLSELSVWRLAIRTPNGQYYKGYGKSRYYDYTQQTLIHTELQFFALKLKDAIGAKSIEEPLKSMDYTHKSSIINPETVDRATGIFAELVDSLTRVRLIEPFASYVFMRANNNGTMRNLQKSDHRCGHSNGNSIFKSLKRFSDKIENRYSVGNIEQKYEVNETMRFDKGCNVRYKGIVYTVELIPKERTNKNINLTRSIYLTFTKYSNLLLARDLDSMTDASIMYVYNIFAPMGLTLTLDCSALGTYIDYIPGGMYICKLFDYAKNHTKTVEFEKVSDNYVYIGDLYQKLFPYTDKKLQDLKC